MNIRNDEMYLFLDQVKFYARHGVDPQETQVGGLFVVDLKLQVDYHRALETDELEHTVSYAAVYDTVKKEMEIPSKLLEHVAGRIAGSLFRQFTDIQTVELKLTKKNPPMGADSRGAGVIITCRR